MCKRRGRKPNFGRKKGCLLHFIPKNAWKCNIFTNKGGGGAYAGYALCWICHCSKAWYHSWYHSWPYIYAKYSILWIFWGSRRMETAPTSIEVLLRPTQSQSDEPSDLRGSLSPTVVYAAPGSPRRSPIHLLTGRDVAWLQWSSRYRWANDVFHNEANTVDQP